jgi:hypothetical protein
LFGGAGWEIVHCNYTNVLVYPAVWLVRRWRALRRVVRTEDRIPPRPINALLRAQFVALAHWRVPFPFGVSLVLVARRK